MLIPDMRHIVYDVYRSPTGFKDIHHRRTAKWNTSGEIRHYAGAVAYCHSYSVDMSISQRATGAGSACSSAPCSVVAHVHSRRWMEEAPLGEDIGVTRLHCLMPARGLLSQAHSWTLELWSSATTNRPSSAEEGIRARLDDSDIRWTHATRPLS